MANVSKDHDCISIVRQELKNADPNLTWIKFELSNLKNSSCSVLKTGQRIEYGYMVKKKDGTEVEKQEKSFVSHNYCPFCGKKYK